MSKTPKLFTISKRSDSNTYRFKLNPVCGLPARVCAEWRKRSFQSLPDELAPFRDPKTATARENAVKALILYLQKKKEEGNVQRVTVEKITVGEWVKKYTTLETSPRTAKNASANMPYSLATLKGYLKNYNAHVKDDPLMELQMVEVNEDDVDQFYTRMSLRKLKDGRTMGGTKTYADVIKFVRMAFNGYREKNHKWVNPFSFYKAPKYESPERDVLTDEEVLRLFQPGVLKTPMQLAVCMLYFYSGLRRAEIFALKPEDLDWKTPKIRVRHSWQLFDEANKMVLGPPKSHKPRTTLFDPVLQEAIKLLWEKNGKHEFVITHKNGKIPTASWVKRNFRKWLDAAGIELGGREITPHSSRHYLASFMEEAGTPIRYIEQILGHSEKESGRIGGNKTTKIYLHTPEKAIIDVGQKVSARKEALEKNEAAEKILNFQAS